MATSIKVLFLAAEAEPYLKVGGLADVAGSLPLALRALSLDETNGAKLDIRLALPLHKSTKLKVMDLQPVAQFQVKKRTGNVIARVFRSSLKRMPVYFIASELLSSAESVYSSDPTSDREKYTFFSLAALDMLEYIGWQPDIIHANDWHTALALFALKSGHPIAVSKKIRSLLTIHNLPYMGGDASKELSLYCMTPPEDKDLPIWARTQPLPLGLWAADAIVAVSPTYAREILTPTNGCGLEGFLKKRRENITGILNGIDLFSFNPAGDNSLAKKFDVNRLEDREGNKKTLQVELNLTVDKNIPIIGMVGRVDQQKGIDLVVHVLHKLKSYPWQFILLGSGNRELEDAIQCLQNNNPNHVRGIFRYDAHLARLIYGGSDMFLMPSRYEPCGLAQMIAMRYGCVPIVSSTGGLMDTVQDGITGFLFERSSANALCDALQRALAVFTSQRIKWREYQRNGMVRDFSWANSARKYTEIYRSLLAS